METLSLGIIGFLLLLLAAMAVFVARVFLYERRRSEARVAALVSLAHEPADGDGAPAIEMQPFTYTPAVATPTSRQTLPSQAHVDRPVTPIASPLRSEAGDPGDQIELRYQVPDAVEASMFVQPVQSSAWGRRLVIIVPLALIITAAGIAFYPSELEIGAPAPAATTEQAAVAAPLELLSLRHAQQSEILTVSGVVQNPRSGASVSKIYATAFVFAADGTFLASGRAPLDFTTLAPGDESAFVVTVPVEGEVARYRIGFRAEDGRVIAHVDRRASGAIARRSEQRP